MRISDWSSDVCSSDLREQQVADLLGTVGVGRGGLDLGQFLVDLGARAGGIGPVEAGARGALLKLVGAQQRGQAERDAVERMGCAALGRASLGLALRSEERRVGNEGVCTCRYRWAPLD